MKLIIQAGVSGNLTEAFQSAVIILMKFVIQFRLLIIRKVGEDVIEFTKKVGQF